MADTDGVQIPFSVDTDGAEVTIEKLAASLLELTDKVDKLGKTAEKTKKAVQFTAFVEAGRLIKDAWKGVGEGFDKFVASMERASEFGSKFQNMSLQFNTSAESLQKLAAAGKPFDVSVDQMARSLNLLDRNFSKIGPQFKKFGIDVKEVMGAKDGADRFLAIASGIGKIKDPAQQAAASFALLKDRSGAFLKMIRDDKGLKEAIKDFEDFGMAVSNNAVGALDKLGSQRTLINDIFTSMKTNFLGAIASSAAFQKAIREATEILGKLSKWVQENQKTIQEWTTAGILLVVDALVFLSGSVIPKVIDAFTGMKILVAGLQAEFKILGDVAVFLWRTLTNPAGIKDNWAALKLATDDTMKDLKVKVDDAMAQNAKWQEGGRKLAEMFKGVRDRIAEAAKKGEDFSAPLKAATDAAGLTADEMTHVEKAAKAAKEQIDDLNRSLRERAIIAAEEQNGLSKTEQAVNKVYRDADEQIRKLEETMRKSFTMGDKFLGIPPETRKALDDVEAKVRKMAEIEAKKLIDTENLRIAEEGLKKVAAQQKELFGGVKNPAVSGMDSIGDELADRLNVIKQAFLQQFGESIDQIDLSKLDPKSLEAVTVAFQRMREDALRAGEATDELDAKLRRLQEAALAQAGDKGLQEKLIRDRVNAMKDEEKTAKTLAKTQGDIIKQMLKNKEITKEQAEKLMPKAVTGAEMFRDALSLAADAAQVLGNTSLSKFIGGLLSAAAAGEQAKASVEAFKKAQAAGDKGGMFKAGAAAASAGIQTAGNIWNANKNNLSGGKAAASGAMQGAAFGAQFGPWGAAIGAVGGALIGFFSGSKFRKIAKDAGKVLGTELSAETVKKIQEDSKKLGISIQKAALLNISTAMAEGKKKASEFGAQIKDLMKGIADGSIPAKEGIEELGKTFGAVADEAMKAGKVGDRVMVDLIKTSRQLKIDSPEIKAFVGEQLENALQGTKKFINAVSLLRKEWLDFLKTRVDEGALSPEAYEKAEAGIKSLGQTAGVVFGAMFSALASERGIVGAVDAMAEDFTKLQETLTETLGPEMAAKVTAPFAAAFATLGNEKLRPIFEGIDGLTQALTGLANAGYLTLDQFTALQDSTATLFDQAIAGGADMGTALQAIAPNIQAAIKAAEEFGVPLDADTQRLKTLAEQNGITFKTDPQRMMLDVLVSIADALGAKIPESVKKSQEALTTLAGTTAQNFATQNEAMKEGFKETFEAAKEDGESFFKALHAGYEGAQIAAENWQRSQEQAASAGGGATAGGTSGPRAVTANVTVNLGINENPLAAADTAAAMRAQTVAWTAEAIEDRIPAIVSAMEGA